jgi:ketosteroid isomerase-like protein
MPRSLLTAVLFLAVLPSLMAQSPDELAIRAVMDKQVADWNRGDIDAFASGYKNSPDILFMGAKIHHGYAEMLANYKTNYSTRAKMGTLSFSDLEIQPLDAQFATATGLFHLVRSAADGGDADGFYLLVYEKTADGWKIVRDDTTVPPRAAAK